MARIKNAGRRRNGTGTLCKRGGIFLARWQVNGKTMSRSTGTADRKEAERKLAEFTAGVVAGNEVATLENLVARLDHTRRKVAEAQPEAPALSLADLEQVYTRSLSRRPVSEHTERQNSARLLLATKWLARWCNISEARQVDKKAAEDFAAYLKKNYAPKTFNDYISLLRKVWRDLADDIKGDNPWLKIATLPKSTHERRVLTREELAAVVNAAQGEWRTLLLIGIYTGLRLGDCIRLQWDAVDLAAGVIVTTPHKTARHGTVVQIPIPPPLMAELQPIAKKSGAVLPTLEQKHGGKTGEHNPSCYIQRLFRRAGIATSSRGEGEKRTGCDVSFHSLRHTYVTLAAQAGVPFAVVQSIVGHTNKAMTAHYFHQTPEALRKAAEALSDIIDTQPTATSSVWQAISELLPQLSKEERKRLKALL